METPLSLEQFIKDQTAALLSLSARRIRAFAVKYGVAMPEDDYSFWCRVHRMRQKCRQLPNNERAKSHQWLKENGIIAFKKKNRFAG